MEITKAGVRELVEQVLLNLDGRVHPGPSGSVSGSPTAQQGVFPDIDSAVRAARSAHNELMARTLETRCKMIAAMRREVNGYRLHPTGRVALSRVWIAR